MTIRKDNRTLVFDQVLPTSSGAITGVIMQPDVIPHAHVGVDVPSREGMLLLLRLQWSLLLMFLRFLLMKLLYPNHQW
jgi:hypothetical protein